jgi:hypothetical protein
MIKQKSDTEMHTYRKHLYSGGKGEGEFKVLFHAMSEYGEHRDESPLATALSYGQVFQIPTEQEAGWIPDPVDSDVI